ncbi:MAG TPA: hypothetical protein DEF16_00745 [Gemmobacter sp.]|nr:MAG: hypothetical protein A2X69_16750 [Rhodobacteraceae bacterium GWF1_65_7]HBD92128.1 hypothetical protein [Gemmobacter sp.]HBU13533.1 hypothetical protein [Gemmobacter sp.]
MEKRVARIELAIEGVNSTLSRLDGRFDRLDAKLDRHDSNLSNIKTSQARVEERLDRVMDKARDMPSDTTINAMLNHKLTVLGIVCAIVLGAAALIVSAGLIAPPG